MQIYRKTVILITTLLLILVFTNLGKHPISLWDEARNGVSAVEMLQNKDWINPHYKGEPDSWAAKPPLTIWSIALSFSLFGFNEFALRLPSAIAILIAFIFIYKIIILYKNHDFAFYTCLILLSVKGLIGWHVGRTGDTDAMLVCFLMIGLFYFLKYFDFNKKNSIYWVSLFWGIAFMVKGPAMAVLIPGLFLYAALSGRIKKLLFSKNVWIAITLFLLFPIGWFLIIHNFGVSFEQNAFGDNVFERLFIYDLWDRFTENEEGWKKAFSLDFFFYSLDKTFNIWNYAFWGFLIYGLFRFFKNKTQTKLFLFNSKHQLLLLSLCLYFPLSIFLTMAAKSHSWYLAPAIPFVGIITFYGINLLRKRTKIVIPIFISVLVFSIGRRFYHFYTPNHPPDIIIQNKEALTKADGIGIFGIIEQDILLYNYFANRKLYFNHPFDDIDLIFIDNNKTNQVNLTNYSIVDKNDNYSIYTKKRDF